MKKMRFKINVPLRGMPAGAMISLDVDREGLPVDRYWRSRVLDARYDGCIEKIGLDIRPKKEKKVRKIKKEVAKDIDDAIKEMQEIKESI